MEQAGQQFSPPEAPINTIQVGDHFAPRNRKFIIVGATAIIAVGFFLSAFYLYTQRKPTKKDVPPSQRPSLIGEALPTRPPEPEYSLGRILFIQNGNIVSFNEETQEVKQLTNTGTISNLAIGKNSNTIFYLNKGDIWQADAGGRPIKQVTSTSGKVGYFELSPDGQYVAFGYIEEYIACCGSTKADYPVTSPYIIQVDGTGQFKLKYPPENTEVHYQNASLEKWYPDSKHILLRGVGILETDNNFLEVDIVSKTVKKFDLYGDYPIGFMPEVYFSPDGTKFVYVVDVEGIVSGQEIWIANIDGSEKRRIFTVSTFLSWLTWSPDGQKLAAQVANLASDEGESLLIFDINGNVVFEVKSLTRGEGFANLVWSEDSQFVAARHYFPYKNPTDSEKESDKITVVDSVDKSTKEFGVTGLEIVPKHVDISGIKIASSGCVYYTVLTDIEPSLLQLWVVNTTTWTNQKVVDNASLPIWLPTN